MTIAMNGLVSVVGADLRNTTTAVSGTSAQLRAVDSFIQTLTLGAGSFNGLHLTRCELTSITATGGSSFMSLILSDITCSGAISITGTFPYGYMISGLAGRGTLTLTNGQDFDVSGEILGAGLGGVVLSGCSNGTLTMRIATTGQHGLSMVNTSHCRVQCHITSSGGTTTNTYDAINISGNSSRNLISGCKIRPRTTGNTTRYGVNVGGTGECNMVVGNDLGDPDDYGTDALVDSASNTQLFWPGDATYGDNFTNCGSGS